ncbi:hypothetical protein HYH02_012374 [Chlamydomonas schloesseri]|uniref:Ammonium transporter n=1 Tax=Chlamydomonas schloesseri TaxID=2026947 RepID=A0A835T1W6_9CHLO|nr:hypothetical protein HYH02_012374 [Chlamydomonas schloesseri]|eukprot:KAG2434358.1 hypothetical protein HYH02_012374 [Chlamydomonas schloesseri]
MASPALDMGGCSAEQYAEVLAALRGDSQAAATLCRVFTSRDRTEEVAFGLNTVFMLLSGALVFIMHGGFAMLEAGAIRSKNAMNILLQTVLDGAASAVMWYLVGFGFAYGIGDNPNGFIGDALFAMSRYSSHNTGTGIGQWTNWFFQWAFCATAATIPAGAVAERFNFNAYLGYSLFLGGFVYPVVAHWVWCPTGWLGYGKATAPFLGAGMVDFAGSGVVHMTGGLAGLTGAWLVGPRLGRFDMDGRPVPMPGHSAILVVLGTVLLWFGWYGFNPGSALVADVRNSALIAGRAAVTTTLSGAAGGLTCLLLGFFRHVAWDLISLCNGMLVGFVAITAGCHVVEPWAALICGFCAAFIFEGTCALLLWLRVDDVVSAGPMHGFCGAWGVLFVGLLAKQEYIQQAYVRDSYPYGLFYGGGGLLLASQVIGILSIGGWVLGTMGPFFLAFKAAGSLRISAEDEHTGLDVSKHGGSAYHHHGGAPHGGMYGGSPHGLAAAGMSGMSGMGPHHHHMMGTLNTHHIVPHAHLGVDSNHNSTTAAGTGTHPAHGVGGQHLQVHSPHGGSGGPGGVMPHSLLANGGTHYHQVYNGKSVPGDSIMRGNTLGFNGGGGGGGGGTTHHSYGGIGNFSAHQYGSGGGSLGAGGGASADPTGHGSSAAGGVLGGAALGAAAVGVAVSGGGAAPATSSQQLQQQQQQTDSLSEAVAGSAAAGAAAGVPKGEVMLVDIAAGPQRGGVVKPLPGAAAADQVGVAEPSDAVAAAAAAAAAEPRAAAPAAAASSS